MSMKNSSDTIGNRIRDLPACSAVSQPTAPPAACLIVQMCSLVAVECGQGQRRVRNGHVRRNEKLSRDYV
jgi:hypothetical protein